MGALEPTWAWKPVWDFWSSLHLWQSSFDAVLAVEDSSPTCPAELGKDLLAFIKVLAANSVLCLFIGRWRGEAPKSGCVKDWMSSHSCGACVKLHVQEEGWISGWQMPVTCTPSPEGYWHMGEDVCLHWDVSEVASRSVLWASYPILARGEGGSFSPQKECVLLRPMLGQGEGCQGEASSVYVGTQMVSFSPEWTTVWCCEC